MHNVRSSSHQSLCLIKVNKTTRVQGFVKEQKTRKKERKRFGDIIA